MGSEVSPQYPRTARTPPVHHRGAYACPDPVRPPYGSVRGAWCAGRADGFPYGWWRAVRAVRAVRESAYGRTGRTEYAYCLVGVRGRTGGGVRTARGWMYRLAPVRMGLPYGLYTCTWLTAVHGFRTAGPYASFRTSWCWAVLRTETCGRTGRTPYGAARRTHRSIRTGRCVRAVVYGSIRTACGSFGRTGVRGFVILGRTGSLAYGAVRGSRRTRTGVRAVRSTRTAWLVYGVIQVVAYVNMAYWAVHVRGCTEYGRWHAVRAVRKARPHAVRDPHKPAPLGWPFP